MRHGAAGRGPAPGRPRCSVGRPELMDLAMPQDPHWETRDTAWDALRACLFPWLRDALARGEPLAFARLRWELETWREFIEALPPLERALKHRQWTVAHRLLWCAEQAAQRLEVDETVLNRGGCALAPLPAFLTDHAGWVWDCIRLLHPSSQRGAVRSPALDVPVAVTEEDQETGFLYTLRLELLEAGVGDVFQHPADTLRTTADAAFEAAMHHAWTAARQLVPPESPVRRCDGRWQLLQRDGHAVLAVSGPSASGAAALGWFHALRSTGPKPGVRVLAAVTPAGGLTGVGQVPAKVQAIAAQRRRRLTIVVATPGDHAAVEAALEELGERARIRCARATTLADLVAIQAPPDAAWPGGEMPVPPQPHYVRPYPMPTHFTGRIRERQMLTEWLTSDRRPILVLTGIGGMGKSALTWAWLQRDVLGLPLAGLPADPPAVAARCRVSVAARPEGLLWWSFEAPEHRFPAFLQDAWTYASAGSVPPANPVRALRNLLQERRILLVLDGFERELDAGRACPESQAAAFLREVAAFSLQGCVLLISRVFPWDLDTAAACRRENLQGLAPAEAVAFVDAQGVHGTRAELQTTCAAYGYHPLALRTLAGMLLYDPVQPGDIRAAAHYKPLLDLESQLQHLLACAYDVLRPPLQALLSLLAAFRDRVEFRALEALWETPGGRQRWLARRRMQPPQSDLRAGLRELEQRHLLDREQGRYTLHPLIRHYAYARLTEKEALHTRLRDYFATQPALTVEHVQSPTDLVPVMELYHHTARAGQYDNAYALFYDRLCVPLYWRFGAYQTCIDLLRELLPNGGDLATDAGPVSRLRLKAPSAQSWTLHMLGNALRLAGQLRDAVRLYQQQLPWYHHHGDTANLASCRLNLALGQIGLGELAAARQNLECSIRLCHQLGDAFREAIGHHELGLLLAYLGAFPMAEGQWTRAQQVFDQQLDTVFMARVGSQRYVRPAQIAFFVSAVRAHRARGALLQHQAEAALEAATEARRCADFGPSERAIIRAEWLLGEALVALQAGPSARPSTALTDAAAHLTDALDRCQRLNMGDHEPDILLAWAHWYRAQGDTHQAQAQAAAALALADRCAYRLKQADIHNFLAQLALDAHQREAARWHADIAHERAECAGSPYALALAEATRLQQAAAQGP